MSFSEHNDSILLCCQPHQTSIHWTFTYSGFLFLYFIFCFWITFAKSVRKIVGKSSVFIYMQHVNHIRFDSNECTAHLRLALNKQPAHELRKQVPEEMINAANGNECRKWNFRCLFDANEHFGAVFLLLSLSTSGFVWFVYERVRCMHDMHWKIPFTCRTGIAANLSSFCVRCFSYMNLNTQRIHNFERLVHGFGYISHFVCVYVSLTCQTK